MKIMRKYHTCPGRVKRTAIILTGFEAGCPSSDRVKDEQWIGEKGLNLF